MGVTRAQKYKSKKTPITKLFWLFPAETPEIFHKITDLGYQGPCFLINRESPQGAVRD